MLVLIWFKFFSRFYCSYAATHRRAVYKQNKNRRCKMRNYAHMNGNSMLFILQYSVFSTHESKNSKNIFHFSYQSFICVSQKPSHCNWKAFLDFSMCSVNAIITRYFVQSKTFWVRKSFRRTIAHYLIRMNQSLTEYILDSKCSHGDFTSFPLISP